MNKLGMWVGIIAGIFGIFWSVYTYWNPFEDSLRNSDDFLGIWQSKYSYSITNGTATVRGTSEYFKNGKYNFIGIMELNSTNNNSDKVKVVYDVDGVGQWNNDSNNLYITLTNSISYPRTLQVNNEQFDLKIPKVRALVPKLEEFVPNNMSEQYVIVRKEAKSMILEVDDPLGKTFSIVMSKVDKRFQR